MKRRQAGSSYVEIYIIDSDYNPAASAIVSAVKTAIDPTAYTGEGYGLAPIGHSVNVQSAESVTANIAATLTLETGLVYDDVKTAVEAACAGYLKELRQEWEDKANLLVRISGLEQAILEVEGVNDVSVTINSSSSNLTLTTYQVPVLGTVTGTVS